MTTKRILFAVSNRMKSRRLLLTNDGTQLDLLCDALVRTARAKSTWPADDYTNILRSLIDAPKTVGTRHQRQVATFAGGLVNRFRNHNTSDFSFS